MGVDSLMICVHLREHGDDSLSRIREICDFYGGNIAGIYTGKWLRCVNQFLYHEARHAHPDDWFLLADADEFQEYPCEIHDLLETLAEERYDYVEGCLIDRVAKDGRFPKIVKDQPIESQFPLGGLITFPLLGGDMRKVVAVRGLLPVVSGQHFALGGIGCPRERLYIPVHHFKWSAGITERLRERAKFYRDNQDAIWIESDRLVHHVGDHDGRIEITDPQFLISSCVVGYLQWNIVRDMMIRRALEEEISSANGKGPSEA
jgi:hypothetical protein